MLTCLKSSMKVLLSVRVTLMTPAIFSAVMSIESRLVMSDKNQTKPPDLRNCEAWRWCQLFAIIVVCYHPFLILFPSLNKFTPVLDDIIPFMTINIHPPLFASILPIQFVKPLLCRPEIPLFFEPSMACIFSVVQNLQHMSIFEKKRKRTHKKNQTHHQRVLYLSRPQSLQSNRSKLSSSLMSYGWEDGRPTTSKKKLRVTSH